MGKRVILSIGDPWECGEAISWRPLRGKLMGEEPMLIELDQPVAYEGHVLNWFVGNPRHASADSAGSRSFSLIGVERLDAEPAEIIRRWRGAATGIAVIADVKIDEGTG